MLDSREEVIKFIESFGFELDVCRWEQPNEAVNPLPLLMFKWKGEPKVKGGFTFTVYKNDRGRNVIDKLQKALISIGKRAKEFEIQKFVFKR